MKTNLICPISNSRIDENIARINAVQTVILILLYLLTSNVLPILLLLVDFILRSAKQSSYSPISLLSQKVHKALKLKPKFVNAGPKLFACRLGVVFSFLVVSSTLFGFYEFAFVVASVFGLFSFLEAAFGFCVACRIYPFIYKFSLKLSD